MLSEECLVLKYLPQLFVQICLRPEELFLDQVIVQAFLHWTKLDVAVT